MTTSLEADKLAVGMITCEMFKGQDSWSSTPDQRRLLPDGRPFYRPIVGGGWFEKKEGAHRPGAAVLDFCNMLPPIDRSTVTLRAGTLLAST